MNYNKRNYQLQKIIILNAVPVPGRQVWVGAIYIFHNYVGLPDVRYLAGLSGIFLPLSNVRMIVIPDNACVNCSIFCATNIDTVNVRYF